MNLKCSDCGTEAEYIYKGTARCTVCHHKLMEWEKERYRQVVEASMEAVKNPRSLWKDLPKLF